MNPPPHDDPISGSGAGEASAGWGEGRPSPELDRLCDRFEAEWKAGRRPSIESYASECSEGERAALVGELVAIEVHHRLQAGEQPERGEYEARFPGCLASPAAASAFPPPDAGPPPASPGASAEADTLRRLDRFEPLEQVGRGAFGTVWRARDRALGREVALKLLHEHVGTSPAVLARYRREAQAAARLSHPAIASVHELLVLDQRPVIVSEFVPGSELKSLIAAGPVDLRLGVSIVAEVAEALDYAHTMGIVHRDVKPANIIVRPDPVGTRAVLVDFGLARHEGSESLLTVTGEVLGTPAYMSPEQAAGLGSEMDGRTDVYSLGVVLYELTTGQLPFQGPHSTILSRVLREEPQRPRQLNRSIPTDLETITLKAMEKDPRARYPTARALADDLRRWLRGESVQARPISEPERLLRWCRRNPLIAAQAALLLVLVLAIAIGASLAAVRLKASRDQALANLDRATRAERERNLKLWDAYLSEAATVRLAGVADRRFRSLATLDRARALLPLLGDEPERRRRLRDEYLATLSLAGVAPEPAREALTAQTSAIAFSPTFACFARADLDSGVSVHRLSEGGEIRRLSDGGYGFRTLRFSSDGRLLVETVRGRGDGFPRATRVWDWERGESVLTLDGTRWPDLSPDGRFVAAPDDHGTVTIHDLATPGSRRTLCTACPADGLAYRPGGGQIALFDEHGVELREVATGRTVRRFPSKEQVSTVAWGGARGEVLAIADAYDIHLRDADTGRELGVLRGHQALVVAMAFDHQGDHLASHSWDATLRLWDVPGLSLIATIRATNPSGSPLAFSADDDRLAFSTYGTTLATLQVANGRQWRRIAGGRGLGQASSSGDLSRDGSLVIAAGRTGDPLCSRGVRVWERASGHLLGEIPSGDSYAAVFTPAGDAVLVFARKDISRWPIRIEPSPVGSHLSAGPPQVLYRGGPSISAAVTPDGTLAVTELGEPPNSILVLPLSDPAGARVIPARPGRWSVAVSPDGRWVATGIWQSAEPRAQVFEAATGRLVVELPVTETTAVRFSSDGRDLVTCETHGYRFWRTGTWTLRAEVRLPPEGGGRSAAFAPAGNLVALLDSPSLGLVRLVDPETGEGLASLSAFGHTTGRWLRFSPDGRLLLLGDQDDTIHIWDVDLLRRELAERGLDWGAPDPG